MQLMINQARYSASSSNVEIPPYVDALQSQLDDIAGVANGASIAFGDNFAILGFYYFTTLVIHESSMFRSAPSWPEPDLRQYKVLHSCLHAMKAWLDRFFLTPLAMYASMPTSIYSQLFYVMVCLHKTTASWDAAWVREIVDLVATLDRVIDTFEQLRAANSIMPPDEADDEGLSLGVRKFQALKIVWQTEVASRASADHAMQEGELFDDSQGLFTAFPMDYFGFNMLPDIFNNVSE
ncbi:hypothetical protein ACEPPN_009295 [Leptodophora sp. 'Broadleaf-Isolate-01']